MKNQSFFILTLLIIGAAQSETKPNLSNCNYQLVGAYAVNSESSCNQITNVSTSSNILEIRQKVFDQEQFLINEEKKEREANEIGIENTRNQIRLSEERALKLQNQARQIEAVNVQEIQFEKAKIESIDTSITSMKRWYCTFNIINNVVYKTSILANSKQVAIEQVSSQLAAWSPSNIACNLE